ncbi:hypothetical protein ACSNOJ_13730 [Streptomyces sp. URMC 128]
MRWVIGVAATVSAFGALLWLGRVTSFGWLPDGEAERWAVAVAFATLGATAVLSALGWWAAQAPGEPAAAGRTVRLRAKATGRGRVTQTAGHHYDTGRAGPAPDQATSPEHIRMRATASEDGQITQTGGDHT